MRYYREGEDNKEADAALRKSLAAASVEILSIRQEQCYYAQLADERALSEEDESRLLWLLAETFEPTKTANASFLPVGAAGSVLEVGPRLSFATAFSSNAVSICESCGLPQVVRLECSRRFLVETQPQLTAAQLQGHANAVHDPMTECVYTEPLESFTATGAEAAARGVTTIGVMTEGRAALERVSEEM